ncbi:MAG TPA: DUF3443 family protein [Burkholderiaceae bacterium]|jgi:hypothetical protein|nr:DUF3443 family protein [Burkholderiaceae bacterium]
MQAFNQATGTRDFVIAVLFACMFLVFNNAPAQTVSVDPSTAGSASSNILPITIDKGLTNAGANRLYVTITVCMPGSTTNCRAIDHVMLDTGATGLTILSSALAPSLSLPQQTLDDNTPLGECIPYFGGNGITMAWGPVKLADVQLAGKRANSIPILVANDQKFLGIPDKCVRPEATILDSPFVFGNGLLGVGPSLEDCGKACAQNPYVEWYYSCPASGCQPTAAPLNKQRQHPVAFFATDNNGFVIELPPTSPGGAPPVNGSLIFGIHTQANNLLGSATVLTVDSQGFFTTVYKGTPRKKSFIDSGVIGHQFFDQDIPRCAGNAFYYCPPATLPLSAIIQGKNGATKAVDFHVDDPYTQFAQHPEYAAFDGIAGIGLDPDFFTWGFPFFLGKSVFVAIEGKYTIGGIGPYFAF